MQDSPDEEAPSRQQDLLTQGASQTEPQPDSEDAEQEQRDQERASHPLREDSRSEPADPNFKQGCNKLQQSSRALYAHHRAASPDEGERPSGRLSEQDVLPDHKMSKFQVGLITATFGEADMLWVYINRYLVDKKYYLRSWREQCKAVSFLSHWLDLTLPQLIKRFEAEFVLGQALPKIAIPCANFKRNLLMVLTIIDPQADIYDWSVSNNSPELASQVMEDHRQILQKATSPKVKQLYLSQEFYGVSVLYVQILNVFSSCRGFDLLFLVLQSQDHGLHRRGEHRQPRPPQGRGKDFSYKPPFHMFVRVTEILNQVREFLQPLFLSELVAEFRSIVEEYAHHFIDEETLRTFNQKDIEDLIRGLEKLLSFTAKEQEGKPQSSSVYEFTEQLELQLALQCLRTPVLDKKFIALNILNQKVREVQHEHALPTTPSKWTKADSGGKNQVSKVAALRKKWLTAFELSRWIEKSQIFTIIFESSFHPEVIKKSQFLLEFMLRLGLIEAAQIHQMWDCAFTKHEAYKSSILKAICSLTSKMRHSHLHLLLEKIRDTPLVDRDLMAMLKAIGVRASAGFAHRQERKGAMLFKQKKVERASSPQNVSQKLQICGKKRTTFDDVDRIKIQKLDTHFQAASLHSEEEKKSSARQDSREDREDSGDITKVPKEKEDLLTADFDSSKRSFSPRSPLRDHPFEEEKVPQGADERKSCGTKMTSVKSLLFEIPSPDLDSALDPAETAEAASMHRLGTDCLKLIWQFCQENTFIALDSQGTNQIPSHSGEERHVPRSVHFQAIEVFCFLLNYQFPLHSFFFMNLCVQNVKMNRSVMASQLVLQKLITGTGFPIDLPRGKPPQLQKKLPANMQELVQALDHDLNITNECISSYVEFKRRSVQIIFERFGNQENDFIGELIGDQDGDLETQSSLDNNTHQTGEDRSRFSQSIVSSTQKSDTADYLTNITRSQQKSTKRRQDPHSTVSQHHYLSKRDQSTARDEKRESAEHKAKTHLGRSEQQVCTESKQMKLFEKEESVEATKTQVKPSFGEAPKRNLRQLDLEEDEEGLFDTIGPLPSCSQSAGLEDKTGRSANVLRKTQSNNEVLGLGRGDDTFSGSLKRERNILEEQKLGFKEARSEKGESKVESPFLPPNSLPAKKSLKVANFNEELSLVEPEIDSPAKAAKFEQSPLLQSQQRRPEVTSRNFLDQVVTNAGYDLSYKEEMKRRVTFLRWLTVESGCQTLKECQVNILWECLVVNAFTDQERDLFFEFCTLVLNAAQLQHLSKTQAGSADILFDENCFELVFFEILLKLDFGQGGEQEEAAECNISTKMYQCFERYFLFINESYGQLLLSPRALGRLQFQTADVDSQPLDFTVFDDQLIGIEALWDIILGSKNEKTQQKASQLLMRILKSYEAPREGEPQLLELDSGLPKPLSQGRLKDNFFKSCMAKIKEALLDLNRKNQTFLGSWEAQELSNFFSKEAAVTPLHPDLVLSQQCLQSSTKITRSISIMSHFIQEFENSRKRGAKKEEVVAITVVNQISGSTPQKVELLIEASRKLEELKEELVNSISPSKTASQLSLLHRGKDLKEDLKTLKDLGIRSATKIILTQKTELEIQLDAQTGSQAAADVDEEQLQESFEQLKSFLGELGCSDSVARLALRKCRLSLEETLMMITNPDMVQDLEDELARDLEQQERAQLLVQKKQAEESGREEDKPLSVMISEDSECFTLLFDLLNLGFPSVTTAAWTLLCQVPVNPALLASIRNLGSNEGEAFKMSQQEWSKLIDPNSSHKMLYSLQLVSQLISANSEKVSPEELNQRFEWRLRFLQSGGFDHLYFILLTYNFEQLSTGVPEFADLKAKKTASSQPASNAMHLVTQAQCLAHLLSIIKVFLQAALLSDGRKQLLSLIAAQQTSPFIKKKEVAKPSQSESDPPSSANTPQFGNSFSSLPSEAPGQEASGVVVKDANDIFSNSKIQEDQTTQEVVDDFPKLIEQLRQDGFGSALLDQVVDFGSLIQQLFRILEVATQNFQQLTSPKEQPPTFLAKRDPTQSPALFLVQNCLDLLSPCVLWDPPQLAPKLTSFDRFAELLKAGLITCHEESVRKSIESTFKTLCQFLGEYPDQARAVRLFLVHHLVALLPLQIKSEEFVDLEGSYFEEFFALLSFLVKVSPDDLHIEGCSTSLQPDDSCEKIQATYLLEVACQQIKEAHALMRGLHKSRLKLCSTWQSQCQRNLSGYLLLCSVLVEVHSPFKELAQQRFNLVQILSEFIFSEGLDSGARFALRSSQGGDTVVRCQNLLLKLSQGHLANYRLTLQTLFGFMKSIKQSWKFAQADFNTDVGIKRAGGYVGLKNFGCTCYMNSLLQQLFMVPSLRASVLAVEFAPEERNVLSELRTVFANLQETEKQFFSPAGFVENFQFYGEPVNVKVQQDSHEFFNVFCDQVEQTLPLVKALGGRPATNFLKQSIGGVLCNETLSLEEDSPYRGERDEDFYSISLDIKNKKSLEEALDLYVKPDVLEGDNKYYCETHGRKVRAQRRTYIKSLADTVVINLKRFEFDYQTQTRLKVNDYCEFPQKINFNKWCKEGIDQAEGEEEHEELGPEQLVKQPELESFESDSEGKAPKQSHPQAFIDQDVNSDDARSVNIEAQREEPQMQHSGLDLDRQINSSAIQVNRPEDRRGRSKSVEKRDEDLLSSKENLDAEAPVSVAVNLNNHRPRKAKKAQLGTNYDYQLVGVLVHSGSADSGHYYSYIKERDLASANFGRWYEFNDTTVKEFDLKHLKRECYGGQGQNEDLMARAQVVSQQHVFERCSNAYLVFYERVAPSSGHHPPQPRSAALESLVQRIKLENEAFKNLKIFCNKNFTAFLAEFVDLCQFPAVPYFEKKCSDSEQMASLRELTNSFVMEVQHFQKAQDRLQQIQQLRGQEVTSAVIKFARDYRAEFKAISAQRSEEPVFDHKFGPHSDVGLLTIKMATVLAQDLVLRLGDLDTFVRLGQKLCQLYQSHARACVWFTNWVRSQQQSLSEILFLEKAPEVRETFANLLSVTFATTAKNEEHYLGMVEQFIDFTSEENDLERFEVSYSAYHQSACIRLVKLLLGHFFGCARLHWRSFNEFFILVKEIAQSHFNLTAYMVQKGVIGVLLNFVLNLPRQGLQMGDDHAQPDFRHVFDLLSYFVRSCLTEGVRAVSHYSPQSIFQEEANIIMLPRQQLAVFTTQEFQHEILSLAHLSPEMQNQAILEIELHLSWGDLESSRLFLGEALNQIRARKSSCVSLDFLFSLTKSILKIEDKLKPERLEMLFNFGQVSIMDDQRLFQSYHVAPIFQFAKRCAQMYPIFALKLIEFLLSLAKLDNHGDLDLEVTHYFTQAESQLKEWLWNFVSQITEDPLVANRAIQRFNIRIDELQAESLKMLARIYKGPFKKEEKLRILPSINQDLEVNSSEMEEATIVNFYPEQKSQEKGEDSTGEIMQMGDSFMVDNQEERKEQELFFEGEEDVNEIKQTITQISGDAQQLDQTPLFPKVTGIGGDRILPEANLEEEKSGDP